MSRTPSERPTTEYFQRQLDDAAEQLGAEKRALDRVAARHAASVLRAAAKDPAFGSPDIQRVPPRPRFGPRARTVVLTAGALLSLSVAAPALRDFVTDDGSRHVGPGAPKADQPIPPDLRPSLAVAHDPVERRYPWGVRTYASRRGHCILTGRVLGGQLVRLQDGKFATLGRTVAGYCGNLRRNHIVVTARNYFELSGGRTVLFGITDRRVASLDLLTAGAAERRPLRIADDNSFITVRRGTLAFRGQRLRIVFTDGRTTTLPLQPALSQRPAITQAP